MLQPSDIIIAQLNPKVGDIEGNAKKILSAYQQGMGAGGKLVICPELVLIGYPPEDLLLMPAFQQAAMQAANAIIAATGETGLVFGTLWQEEGGLYNVAILASHGKIQHIHRKMILPNFGVFDERRYFAAGDKAEIVSWQGQNLGLLICEDIWHEQPLHELSQKNPELIIVINASPFESGKIKKRHETLSNAARYTHTPIAYINTLGGQDDIVFDGGSFIVDAKGELMASLPQFKGITQAASQMTEPMDEEAQLWNAMCLGLSDYVYKNGFKGVLLGLSGGIDSALTAAVAVDALGAENVQGVLLPSPYSSAGSIDDALALAQLLAIHTDTIPIADAMQVMQQTLDPVMGQVMDNIAIGGNIQARIRGQILMAMSNKTGKMLLSTGNKSEIAVGYSTLYGDSCGGYNVIKDVYKTDVYRLAKWCNEKDAVIPENSITKPPSAELAPGQKDSDQLPEYEVLDAILRLHLEGQKSYAEITHMGYDDKLVEKILRMVRLNEYKRRQSAPGVKLSPMLFGKDRRYPLTNGFPG